jgi:hypothetical protein
MMWSDRLLSSGQGILAAMCLVLLPLCGGPGLALIPPLAIWLVIVGVGHLMSPLPFSKLSGALIMILTGLAVLLGLYVVAGWYQARQRLPMEPASFWSNSLQVVATSLGPEADTLRGYAGWGIVGLVVVSLLALGSMWHHRPLERMRVARLVLFLAGGVLAVAAAGYELAGRGPATGSPYRYSILAALVLANLYFFWSITSSPLGRLIQMALLLLLCAFYLPNVHQAAKAAQGRFDQVQALERDVAAGLPPFLLAERHADLVTHFDPRLAGDAVEGMRLLRRAGFGIFQDLNDPELQEVALPLEPTDKSRIRWRDGVARGLTGNAPLTYVLDKPRQVLAIRLTFAYELAPNETAQFRMSWKRAGVNEFAERERNFTTAIEPPANGQALKRTLTVWVNDTIDQIRIQPDRKPYVLQLSAIVLLVPAAASR